jgi:hypothetical protein
MLASVTGSSTITLTATHIIYTFNASGSISWS